MCYNISLPFLFSFVGTEYEIVTISLNTEAIGSSFVERTLPPLLKRIAIIAETFGA